MENCRQTLLHILDQQLGFNGKSPLTKRLAKKLSQDKNLQHHINALELALLQALEQTGAPMHRKPRKNSSFRNRLQLKNTKPQQLPVLNIKMRAPNLTAGKDFKESIVALGELPGQLEFHSADGLAELPDVVVDGNKLMVAGSITAPGDYEVKLRYFIKLANGNRQRLLGTLKITVIPDPRSLWNDLPSDPSARFHKPDSHSDSLENEAVVLIGASVRGRSHAHKGIHRDDDFKLISAGTSQWNVLCVADGAGSCKYSRRGAELAALRSSRTLQETLAGHYGEIIESAYDDYVSNKNNNTLHKLHEIYQHTIVKAVHVAAMAINKEANAEGDKFKDFSTTLLLAAHKPVADGHLVIAFWIGDGGAAIYSKGQQVRLLGEPDSGEFAGQTRFLDNKIFQDGSVYNRVVIEKVPAMTALILATDGITDAKFETEKQLANIAPWDALWQDIAPHVTNKDLKQGEKDLISWMGFWSQGNHDDRSIAICWVKE